VDGCIYVGAKVNNWEYPINSTRMAANNEKGFIFRGQNNPGSVARS
jgi:hypothetical protein